MFQKRMDNEENIHIELPEFNEKDKLSDVVVNPSNKYIRTELLTTHQELFMRSLEKNMWIISKAVDETWFSRNFHYWHMTNTPAYRHRYEHLVDRCIDYVETALYKKIKNGDSASIMFYLRNMWANRGWNRDREQIAEAMAPKITVSFRPKNAELPPQSGSQEWWA